VSVFHSHTRMCMCDVNLEPLTKGVPDNKSKMALETNIAETLFYNYTRALAPKKSNGVEKNKTEHKSLKKTNQANGGGGGNNNDANNSDDEQEPTRKLAVSRTNDETCVRSTERGLSMASLYIPIINESDLSDLHIITRKVARHIHRQTATSGDTNADIRKDDQLDFVTELEARTPEFEELLLTSVLSTTLADGTVIRARPCPSGTKRGGVMNGACVSLLVSGINDGSIIVEGLSIEEYATFMSTGKLPDYPSPCVLCTRALITQHIKMYTDSVIVPVHAHSCFSQTFWNPVGCEGGYKESVCFPNPQYPVPPFLVQKPMVMFDQSLLEWKVRVSDGVRYIDQSRLRVSPLNGESRLTREQNPSHFREGTTVQTSGHPLHHPTQQKQRQCHILRTNSRMMQVESKTHT